MALAVLGVHSVRAGGGEVPREAHPVAWISCHRLPTTHTALTIAQQKQCCLPTAFSPFHR